MQWTQTFIPTLREDPQEAEIDSHKLMLRAGLIRKLGGGLYTFLPLGFRVLKKIENIIREEMDNAGALEILMPALHPKEIWEKTGRYISMGDVMFKLQDRQKKEYVLGPTHEEIVTSLAAAELRSYRQLPKTFYQIQVKFRDEIRPRFGLMRAKEFIMKDAYSFDTTWEAADASYEAMYKAYVRIFKRCGLRTKVVEADTGAMGGNWSHEFMVIADSGEDGIVECESCSYAANLEKAERAQPAPKIWENPVKPCELVNIPGHSTINQVSAFLNCKTEQLIKTIIYIADNKPVAVLVSGDRDINEHKLARKINASSIALADETTIQQVTGAPAGFAGPLGLSIPVYCDIGLKGIKGGITGANKKDAHILHVDLERDATIKEYIDISTVKDGDLCPKCGKPMHEKRGIEVGHVFKLGTKYTDSLGAIYLDENRQQNTIIMGCYGIGVTRTLQAIIEQLHDKDGIIWPFSVAPYQVVILPLNIHHQQTITIAKDLSAELQKAGVDTIIDDRDERPGVKFKDADLVGFPLRVVIGEKNLASNKVEIKRRDSANFILENISKTPETILNIIKEEGEKTDNLHTVQGI